MTKAFRGGIQKGSTAFDVESKALDNSAKNIRDLLIEEFSSLKLVKTMTREMKLELVGDDCFGFSPDGGAWFDVNGKWSLVLNVKSKANKEMHMNVGGIMLLQQNTSMKM